MYKSRGKVHRAAGLALGLLALGLVLGIQPQAADKASSERKLRAVLQQIEKIKQAIEVKEDSKSRYIGQLRSIERDIGEINRQIRAAGDEIKSRQAELAQLRKTRLGHQQQLARENRHLAEQVYTAFTVGRQERVKLLFSQQDAQTLQRNLVYYQYFSNARVELIESVRHNIDKIVETEALIRDAQAALEAERKQLGQRKAQLDEELKKRRSIIGSLDSQLQEQGGRLARLEDEAEQLQQLINSIQDLMLEAPEEDIPRQAFASLKGKLAWPVEGKVRRLYGKRKPDSDLRWQGVRIDAPSGRYVRAVSHGRVAFADWLRGFGNLLIIDHGNSFMSLYGHNESLFKEAGEWVEAGEVISSVGDSGGQSKPGLYFEIRKRGKPQNPTGWCKAGNRFASG